MKPLHKYAATLTVLVLLLFAGSVSPRPRSVKPDNIILMIGDGMGVSEIYAGMVANHNHLNLERCTFVGFQKTYAADRFITDSGASGTALASGSKTNYGSIGVDTAGKALKSIAEFAEDAGLNTGIVVTCAITHATPAVFYAHSTDRHNYEQIAADILSSGLELFIGGGRTHFRDREDGRALLEELQAEGYTLMDTLPEMGSAARLPLAVITDSMHMPPASMGRGDLLPRATETAVQLLSENKKGFFLMVEGSQIDFGGHANSTEYIVSEMIDFDNAVGKALDFATENKHTLVIVTADHETGGFAVESGDFTTGGVTGDFTSRDHTGVMVPVFAYGPGAEEFAGIYENTAVFEKMADLLNLR